MKPDLYTKAVLTVIAASLLWLGAQNVVHPQAVSAQEAQRVIIVGIENRAEDAISAALNTYKGVTATALERQMFGNSAKQSLPVTLDQINVLHPLPVMIVSQPSSNQPSSDQTRSKKK